MAGLSDRLRRAERGWRAFGRAEGGAAAVEFAMVAFPFFLMMFAVLEVALVFFASTNLENATAEAAREIRTGQFQASGGGESEFRAEVCERASRILDCDRITVDVRTFNSFAAVDPANPINDEGELDDGAFTFNTGAGRQIVLVRVFYEWRVITPMLGDGFSNMAGNTRLLTAAAAFRNEPFE